MNQRIRELAEQAYDLCNKRTYGSLHSPEEFNQKFAELIVRECINIAKICECIDGSREPDPYFQGVNDAIRITIERLEAHFGVEE